MQFVIVANGAVTTVFHGPQDPADKPGYQEIQDNDPLWVAYQAAQTAGAQTRAAQGAFIDALAQGLQIQSTATPALNGTYAIDDAAQKNISGIAAGIASRNRVPGGGATFDYPDVTITDHAFSAADFLNFAAAVEDYVYALSRGQAPAQPIVIA